MLGRDYKKSQSNRASNGANPDLGATQVGAKSRPAPATRPVDESDDEGGRSSLGRSKRQKLDKELQNGTLEAAGTDVESVNPNPSASSTAFQPRKRSSNYLDEVLAKKAHKKSKKKKKKKKHGLVPIAAE